MENSTTFYMADFTLPKALSEDFIQTIPDQRREVSRLFSLGKLKNYALSLENSKLWAVFAADTEVELWEMVSDLPLSRFMQVHVSALTFFNAFSPAPQLAFSAN